MRARKRRAIALALLVVTTSLVCVQPAGAADQTITVGNNRAILLLPFFHQARRSYRVLQENLRAMGYQDPVVLKDRQVDVAAFKNLSQYSVIFIQTHGGVTPWPKERIGLISTYQEDTAEAEKAYEHDINAGRVTGTNAGGENVLAVSADFLARANGNFPNSLVYLFSCDVMEDKAFGKTLNQRNVQAVIGFKRVACSWDPPAGTTEDNMTLDEITANDTSAIADDRETRTFFDMITGGRSSIEDSYHEVFRKTPGVSFSRLPNPATETAVNNGPPCIGWVISTAYDTDTTSYLLSPVSQRALSGSDTAFVLDVSGSMEGQKIADLKKAATALVDMIENEANSQGINHQVGLVTFTTDSEIISEVTDGFESIKSKIDRLTSQDSTNMEAGIRDGTTILTANPSNRKRIMILLSDGVPNEGASTREALINGVVAEAKSAGITIYTVGFGARGSSDDIDEGLLKAIASDTAGTYKYASNGFDLSSAYLMTRHETTGNVIFDKKGTLSGSKPAAQSSTFEVRNDQGELNGTLNWSGDSELALQALDPDGVVVDSTYVGAYTMLDEKGFSQYIIRNPKPGKWKILVKPQGKSSSVKSEYLVIFSTSGSSKPITTYPKVLAIVCGAAVLLALLGFLLLNRRISRG